MFDKVMIQTPAIKLKFDQHAGGGGGGVASADVTA